MSNTAITEADANRFAIDTEDLTKQIANTDFRLSELRKQESVSAGAKQDQVPQA